MTRDTTPIGAWIKYAQDAFGLSDEGMAELVGARSGKTVRRWKMWAGARDRRVPPAGALAAIVAGFAARGLSAPPTPVSE